MRKKDKLDIIYEDKNYLVINKPAHLLTIGTEDEKINTLYHKAHDYVYKKNKNNKIFIVHRLDRDTSGIVVFVKNQKLKSLLQADWNKLAKKREYIAIVEGYVKKPKDRIVEYLAENKTFITYATSKNDGKEAITNYEVVNKAVNSTTLKISIETGRKNQIRVAMANMGHPIIGDKKYGSKKNPLRRMCLHASKLELIDPITKNKMIFEAKKPHEFKIFE